MNKDTEKTILPQVTPKIFLRAGRAHEAYGSAKYSFAAYICSLLDGPAIWITECRQMDFVNPDGLASFCNPGKFIFAFGPTHLDVLWMAEEALRSGVIPIVVVNVQKPIGLTAGRRLQLAAETGGGVGLFLISQGFGSNAAETRWDCSSGFVDQSEQKKYFEEDSTLFDWRCIKNKSGTLIQWMARWDGAAHHMYMVEQVGKPEVVKTYAL